MTSTKTKSKRFGSLAIWFTVAVALLILAFLQFVERGAPDFPSIGLVACVLSLASMVAVWCPLISGWKIYVTGLVVIGLDGLSLAVLSGPDLVATVLPLGVAVPCCLTIELIKFLFGKFSMLPPGDQDFKEGLQFKLSHLFIATAFVAVLCSIGQALAQFISFERMSNHVMTTLFTIAIVLAINTLLCVWAILGKTVLWRIAITIPLVIGLALLGDYLLEAEGLWTLIFLICSTATLILLTLLRLEGYRFVRKSINAV